MPPRKKLELADCVERVVDMFNNQKMSCREISDCLASEGVSVSYSTVARAVRLHNEAIAEQARGMIETRQLMAILKEDIDGSNDNDIDLILLMNSTLKTKLVQELAKSDLELKDLEKITYMIDSASSTQIKLEKLRFDKEAAIEKAKEELQLEFRNLLMEDYPEMLLTIIDLIRELRGAESKTINHK